MSAGDQREPSLLVAPSGAGAGPNDVEPALFAERELIVAGLVAAQEARSRAEAELLEWTRRLRENGERLLLSDGGQRVQFRVSAEFAYRSDRAELSAALRVSERQADVWLDLATALDELPQTAAALSAGAISLRHASEIASASLGLSPDDRGAIDREGSCLARATTSGRLARRLRTMVERLHPEQAAERHRLAAADRTVCVSPAKDGMAWLEALLPAAQAHAIHDRLESAATAARSDADERTRSQLRADLLADALLHGPLDVADRSWLSAVAPTVHVTVPVLTLLGRSDEPAELEGYGPIDSDTAKRLAASAPSFQRLLTHPVSGAVLAVDRTSYRVPEDLRRWLRVRDETCRFPGCGRAARRCELDHCSDWALGGGTDHDNLAHLCKSHHALKHHSTWTYRHLDDRGTLEWTAPSGRTYVCEAAKTMGGAPPTVAGAPLGGVSDELLDYLESTADDEWARAEWPDDWHRLWSDHEQLKDELSELMRGLDATG